MKLWIAAVLGFIAGVLVKKLVKRSRARNERREMSRAARTWGKE